MKLRRKEITLCPRNWKKPNPIAKQSLQVTMEAANQHFLTRGDNLFEKFCPNGHRI